MTSQATLLLDHLLISNNRAGGVRNEGGILTITNSTLSGNKNGGIYNEGTLTVINSTLTGNSAVNGGGIYNEGVLTVTNTTISGNSAVNGGGIYCVPRIGIVGELTITNSTISGNSASDSGGGIYGGRGYDREFSMTIVDSIISDNSAKYGGGISVESEYATTMMTLVLTNTTLANNVASNDGGGLMANSQSGYPMITVTNSTFSGNSANRGGGIYDEGEVVLAITNSTLIGNSANGVGGGIYFQSCLEATLNNTVVAGNTAPSEGPDIYNYYGDVSGTHNLIGDGSDQAFLDGVDGNQVGTSESPIDPTLGPLQDNGGSTPTHAPLPGSPLIDGGSGMMGTGSIGEPLLTDQRGFLRKWGTVDIGAVEDQPAGVPIAYGDVFELNQSGAISFETSELLANDFCNDGSVLVAEILSSPRHGTLVTNPDGTMTYTPEGTFWGTDSFTYRALNGSLESNVTEVIFSVVSPQSIIVTTADDEQDGDLSAEDISLREATVNLGASQIQFSAKLFDQAIKLSSLAISNVHIVGLGAQHLTIDGNGESGFLSSGNSTISDLRITGNMRGVGISVTPEAILLVDHVDVSHNSGGGLFNVGTLTVTNSTISGNSAYVHRYGGAIYNIGALSIINSTITNNLSIMAVGGGIYNYANSDTNSLTITNCTITGNSADRGGGIYNCGSFSNTVTLNNTLIANNTASSQGPDLYFYSGTLSGSHNLIGDGDNQNLIDGVDGNQVGTSVLPIDPMLDDSGVPAMGSPAIDAGDNALIPSGINTDLAGNARIFNDTVDIGAYESEASKYRPGDANNDGRVDGSDVTILAGNWQAGVPDGDPENVTWSMGDFNGDGRVDGSDVTILAGNWQAGVSSTVIAVSDPEPKPEVKPTQFVPPATASLGVATVPRREALPPRRFITPGSEVTDTVLTELSWSGTDVTAIAKELTPISVKKSTAASDEIFALELDPYGDLQ